jgi:Arc/MetJ-type ribon-helix-helix transcriptional regulator
MPTAARAGRAKLSTTVDSANFQYLETLVRTGEAHSLADAVDRAVRLLRKTENRKRLERDTDAYFSGITEDVLREENALAESLSTAAKGIDYDLEA